MPRLEAARRQAVGSPRQRLGCYSSLSTALGSTRDARHVGRRRPGLAVSRLLDISKHDVGLPTDQPDLVQIRLMPHPRSYGAKIGGTVAAPEYISMPAIVFGERS